MNVIQVGAGQAPIQFEKEMFPTPGEGYTGIHDAPDAHAVCFEQDGARYVFLNLNLVSYPDTPGLQKLAAEMAGTEPDRILVHCTHNVSTPHAALQADITSGVTFFNAYCRATKRAVQIALTEALARLKPAVIRFYTAVSYVNVSRLLEWKEGLWQGTNEAGVSDHTVPIIRIDDAISGKCIAILYAVNMAPGVMEGSFLRDSGRLITGDIAGASERYLREAYPDAVCCYCLGASGDQWAALRAMRETLTVDGELVQEDLHETGFVYVDALGRKLANSIVNALRDSGELIKPVIQMEIRDFVYPGQKEIGRSIGGMQPGKIAFEAAEDVHSDTALLMLGDIALVGAHAEINVGTLQSLRNIANHDKIFFTAFTNGALGYMTEKEVYDAGGYQCRKSVFARGSAEMFAENMAAFINQLL